MVVQGQGHAGGSLSLTAWAAPAGRDVTVNGVPVRPPKAYTGTGLTLERAGLFLLLLTRMGLAVLWDGGETRRGEGAQHRAAAGCQC